MRSLRALKNKAPVPYTASGRARGLLLPSVAPVGMEAQMRAAGSVGTLFAIVNRLIEAYSQVEWHLYKSAASGRKEDREPVTDHPAVQLWESPNPFMTGPAFRETTQQHEELVGEQWWVVVPHDRLSIPGELWPVRPDRMEPIPDTAEFLTEYQYRAPGGGLVRLDKNSVVFLRRPNPLDIYRGMGAVQTILSDVEGSRLAADWVRNFFYNNASPGGVIEVDHNLDDPEWDQFQSRWAESHRGVANAHRVAMLERGMKWVDRRFTMQELQIEGLRSVPRELIREAFGFPRPMLGTVDDTNRANMEAADTMMARWLSKPRLERTKQALNTRLLPMYGPLGRGYEFDYDNPVPADVKTDADVLASSARAARDLVAAGYWGPSVLSAVGLPEIQYRDPNYDENRETLIRIVTGAPTTAPIILPLLGFDLGVDGGNGARPQDIANVVQKLYLGVDKILTWEEARAIVARLGVDLDLSAPRPVVNVSAPAWGVPSARAVVEAVRLPEAGQLALAAGGGVEDSGGVDIENAMRWIVRITDDGDTCLAPEARVTTRGGLVPAKDVTLDDELLTHSGRWVTPSHIVVSEVEEQLTRVDLADGRSLRLTWDHPVLVRAGDGFAWRNAGDLAVGDLVVDQSSLEFDSEVGGVDLGLGQAPDGVAPVGYVGGLPAVDVGSEAVPVGAVGLDGESVPDHEVDDPRADLDLGSVGVPQVFEGLADAALDAGLCVAGSVAAHRAVPLTGGDGGDDSHIVPAVLAGHDDGRSSAGLGAVPAFLGPGVAEAGAASGTLCATAPGVDAAHAGAVGVPVGSTDGDAELGIAMRARLGDATPLVSGCGAPGDKFCVGIHALARAVDLAGAPPARDLDRAGLASCRRPARVSAQPGSPAGAAEAERASLDRLTAVRTRLIHGQSVQVTTVQIRAVVQEPYAGEVYDFTIPDDETFWAEGVLVHNCHNCRENDGKLYKNREEAYRDYPEGEGYVRCEGVQYGNACRCKVVKRRKGDDGEE